MTMVRAHTQVAALLRAWLVLDFFGDARRSGNEHGSSLTTTIFSQSFLAFVFAALLYPETPAIAFAAANLSLSTLLVTIGALGDDALPQRRGADDVLLATAPIARGTLVIARAMHAAFHLLLVTIGLALPPAILLAFVTGQWLQAPAYLLAACACTGLAVASLATLRALLERLVGVARATLLLGTLRAGVLGGGFVLFVLGLQRLHGDAAALPIGRAGAELLPPYHAARVLAAPAQELWRVATWAAVAAALLAASIALAGLPRSPGYRVARHSLLRALLTRIAAPGKCLGIAAFVATTMWRSAGFRARVLPLLGLPAGMVFLSMDGDEQKHRFTLLCLLLQLPAIYLPFLIAFLPRADQRGVGWVFEHAPGVTIELVRDATARALVTHVLLPVHAVAAVLLWCCGEARAPMAAAVLFAFACAVVAAFAMTRMLRCVPFTEDRDEEAALDLGGLLAGALALGGLGTLFGAALSPAWRWPVAAVAAAVAFARVRAHCPAGGPASTAIAGGNRGEHGMSDGASGGESGGTASHGVSKHRDDGAERGRAAQRGGAEARGAAEWLGDRQRPDARVAPLGQPTGPATAGRPDRATTAPEPLAAASAGPQRSPSIRSELRAILVLYVALSLLPSLFGAVFAP